MTKTEALKLALENLLQATRHLDACPATVAAAEAALAQPEQEPDYNICHTCGGMASDPIVIPLKREWVSLTPEQYDAIWCMDLNNKDLMDRTIAKLKELNHD